MATKGRRAAVYARLSQDRGLEKVSVPRQVKECRDLAARLGWDVVDEFEDRDISASNRTAKRPGYDGLLEALRSGQVNAVLARETSRLYRRPRQLEDLIDLIEGKGVEIATVYEGEVDLSTSNGRMMARIRVGVDKAESERIGERVRSAKQQKKADGVWLGGGRRPYGYNPVDEPGRPRRFVKNAAEARVIRDIARRLIGGASLHRVTVELNGRAVPTAGGGRWKPAHVKRLMVRDLPSASFPAILKADEARILEARLANGKAPKGRGTGARRYVLTGLVFCSACGSKMIGSGGKDSHGNHYELYRCASRQGGCGKVSIGAIRLEKYVVERLWKDEHRLIYATREDRPPEIDDVILAEMAEIENRRDGLASNLELSERVVAIRTRAFDLKLEGLRKALLVPRQSGRPETKEDIVRLTKRAYEQWFHHRDPSDPDRLSDARVLELHETIATAIREIRVLPKRPVEDPDLEPLTTLGERVVIHYQGGKTGGRRAR